MTSVAELSAALIAVFEGERLTAYPDSGGVWTIGFGHTGPILFPNPQSLMISLSTKAGLIITHDEAVLLFRQDAAPLFAWIDADLRALTPLQQSAWISFAYNCGLGTAKSATVETMQDHVHDKHGNILPGLVARRRLEYLLALG